MASQPFTTASFDSFKAVFDSITDTSTVQDFERVLGDHPQFPIDNEFHLLNRAVKFKNVPIVAAILTLSKNIVNQRDLFGCTPLLTLCTILDRPEVDSIDSAKKCYTIAQMLLDTGASLDCISPSNEFFSDIPAGVTPLWIAASRNHLEITQLFLARGAKLGSTLPTQDAQDTLREAQSNVDAHTNQVSREIESATDLLPPLCHMIGEFTGNEPPVDFDRQP